MISNKAQLAEYGIVVVTIVFLLAAMYFIPPRLTGLAVIPPGASVVNLTPTNAIDWLGNEQISPDNGVNDGTVDVSNNDARSLNADGANINVTAWDQAIPQSTINNATAYCEIDSATSKAGSLSFSYNTGGGWSAYTCIQPGGGNRILKCDLFKLGVNSVADVNNLDLRCRMNTTQNGNIGFSIDSVRLEVVYKITTTTSTSTSTSTTSTSTSSSTTSTSTISTTTSTSSTSTSTSTTSSSTTTINNSTSTSSITTTTVEPETTVGESSNSRRETTTIQQPTSIIPATIQPETTQIATTTAQLATTSIAPTTGQFELAGRAITNNIIQPVENRLLALISSILGLIYIYYKQTRKNFPRKAHMNELKKDRKRGYY